MVNFQNKTTHKIIDLDGVEYDLYVVSTYELEFPRSIIIAESATGDGGLSYDNGRLQEQIPINGTLLGKDLDDVNDKKNRLIKLQGKVIEFISAYPMSDLRTNKFLIQNIRFTIQEGRSDSIPFNLILQEKRDVNVNSTSVNLVNFEPAQFFKQLYNQTIGNV